MKKIIIIIIGLIGLILIGIGVVSALTFINHTVKIPSEMTVKEPTLQNNYQQQLIMNIEKSLEEGYQLPQGVSTLPASTFFEGDTISADVYRNCSGEVTFTNQNGMIRYQLNTNCKKDSATLKLDYTATTIPEQALSSAISYPVSDGYILIGAIDENDTTEKYTANALLLKFDQNHNLIFSQKISDTTIENMNSSSYVEIKDIYEDTDGYYLLGDIENASGGDFTELIAELTDIYANNAIENKDNNFSFLLKYDKNGNLIMKKLINPIEGDLSVNNMIGKKNHSLFIATASKIIEYNTVEDKFKYHELPNTQLKTSNLVDDSIYGYTVECNIKTEKNEENKNGIIKMSLTGKKLWQRTLDVEETLKSSECSNLIDSIYHINARHILVYEKGKKLSVYNDHGENIKDIDYTALAPTKKEKLTILDINQKNNEIELILENDSYMIRDILDEEYKLKKRTALNIEKATELLENISDVENMIPTKNGWIKNKVLKRQNGLSILRMEYQNDEA